MGINNIARLGKDKKVFDQRMKQRQALAKDDVKANKNYIGAHNQLADSIEVRNQAGNQVLMQGIDLAGDTDIQQSGLDLACRCLKPAHTLLKNAAQGIESKGAMEESEGFLKGTGKAIMGNLGQVPKGLKKAAIKGLGFNPAAKGFIEGLGQHKDQAVSTGTYLKAAGKALPVVPTALKLQRAQASVTQQGKAFKQAENDVKDIHLAKLAAQHGGLKEYKNGKLRSGGYQAASPEALLGQMGHIQPKSNIKPQDLKIPVPNKNSLLAGSAPEKLSPEKPTFTGTPKQQTEAVLAKRDAILNGLKEKLETVDMDTVAKPLQARDYHQAQTAYAGVKAAFSEPASLLATGLGFVNPTMAQQHPDEMRMAHERLGTALGKSDVITHGQKAAKAQAELEIAAGQVKPQVKAYTDLRSQQIMETERHMSVDNDGDQFYDAYENDFEITQKQKQYREQAISELPQSGQGALLQDNLIKPVPSGLEWMRRPVNAWLNPPSSVGA